MTTPAWSAARNGLPGDLDAANASAQVNQHLGGHAIAQIGYGNPVVTPIAGQQSYVAHAVDPLLITTDFAQAFTMSGTATGRITVPVKAFGAGADLLLSLCPDSAGTPNTAAPIAQVKVPAAVIMTLGAQNGLENPTGPLQTAAFNTQFGTNFSPQVPWISPASTANGAPGFFAVTTSGNYTILLGGKDTTTNTPVALVYTVQYTGGGTVAPPIPQAPLPQPTQAGQACATPDTVVYMGGYTTLTTAVANVWSASWNPLTGQIGAWSAQTPLPQGIAVGAAVSWGQHIYLIGGQTTTTGSTSVANVWMNTATNSQLGAWAAMPPLPKALNAMFAGVVGNWLIVAGGNDTTVTPQSACYFAPIRPDGTLGPWQNGPTMTQPVNTITSQWCTGVTSSSLVAYSGSTTGGALGSYMQVLSVGASGPAPSWNSLTSNFAGERAASAFTDGNGVWYLMGYNIDNTVQQNLFLVVPLISAPLYATGLTNGATYWVVAQELQSGSASDYLGIGVNYQAYPVDAKVSSRHAGSWSTYFGGFSVPLTVYDTTPGLPVVHTVEDLAAGPQSATYQRWSTLLYTAQQLLTGVVEVTMQPNGPLNSNPTFTSGVSPWTATGGTITQSAVQTRGGYAFSGLLAPSGTAANSVALSELVPVRQGGGQSYGTSQWYLVDGWLYSPTGYGNVSLSVAWCDRAGNHLSTTATVAAVSAATWTHAQNYVEAPATAAQAQIQAVQGGTPAAGNLLYVSDVVLVQAAECVGALASAATVDYPAGAPWPPLGVTQLL
jgi:hypothetical protein